MANPTRPYSTSPSGSHPLLFTKSGHNIQNWDPCNQVRPKAQWAYCLQHCRIKTLRKGKGKAQITNIQHFLQILFQTVTIFISEKVRGGSLQLGGLSIFLFHSLSTTRPLISLGNQLYKLPRIASSTHPGSVGLCNVSKVLVLEQALNS